jgi:Asp/Glu/hydantoin racemase
MMVRVAFLHTIHGLEDTFDELCRECLPECEVFHIADDSLIQRLLRNGRLTPDVSRRVCDHVLGAVDAGADYVQLTCSSISPVAPVVAALAGVPILTIDAPMMRAAVQNHDRIGVIATNPATLSPSTELAHATASALGRETEVVSTLCEGAYPALLSGDRETHDRIVLEHLAGLVENVEAVCLAQASMARLAEEVKTEKPIYSSPRPAMAHLGRLMREGAGGE